MRKALLSSAVFSSCGLHRLRLDRTVRTSFGKVYAYFGVNPSKAGGTVEDQTTKKWNEFTFINGGVRYIAANAFSRIATDVSQLAGFIDPVGPENPATLAQVIAEADILVPCWGSREKVPKALRWHFDAMRAQLFRSGKPVRVFGLTESGDPKHPMMLGYDTPLIPWNY